MKTLLVIISVVVIAALVVSVFGVATLISVRRSSGSVSSPVVDITLPQSGKPVEAGMPVMLQAVASDPDGVATLELWLDGKIIKRETSPREKGSSPLPLAYSVKIDAPGDHQFIARGTDIIGNQGQSSLVITVVHKEADDDAAGYTVREGDTLDNLAEALAVPVEDISGLNPGMESGLPPAGEVIILPTPLPDSDEDEMEPPTPVEETSASPGFFWDPPAINPRWLLPLEDVLTFPGSRIEPAALMNITLLEVDADYDGVFCYVSAGDSPVVRIPAEGFLNHLSGRYWDIAEWFAGDNILPFISSSGRLEVRMNCVGYYETTGGGIAYNLGTLAIDRSVTGAGTGVIDERTPSGEFWFRVVFSIDPLGSAAIEGLGVDSIVLDSVRYGPDQVVLVPEPHAVLEFRLFNGLDRVPPPVVDGFLIYRNGSLWRTTEPSTERYVVWDHLLEAGGCGQQTEFFVAGYMGNPLSPDAILQSNKILISGYCPLDTQFKLVTVQFNWFYSSCLFELDVISGLHAQGLGGPENPTIEDVLSHGCTSALDNFGPVSYGGLNVNGHRVIDFPGTIQFTPRLYDLHQPPWDDNYVYQLTLAPDDTLTVSSTLYDYDVWSYDDFMCWGSFAYSPEDLAMIIAEGGHMKRISYLTGGEGSCAMEFEFTVEPFYVPPPVVVP